MAYTLELLHIADQEASTGAIGDASNLSAVLEALRPEDIGNDGVTDNTVTLSSGDAFIPGVFFNASETAFGSTGIADIQTQNRLGIQAIALGNHEFDFGTEFIAGLIDGSETSDFSNANLDGIALDDQDFLGTNFPYLSWNLDFSTDPNLTPLETAGSQAPQGNAVTSSTVIDAGGGEQIGVIGHPNPWIDFVARQRWHFAKPIRH